MNDVPSQVAAIREGLGAGLLPCFIGDADSGLQRLTSVVPQAYGQLWILVHEDLRNTARVQAFNAAMSGEIQDKRGLLEGHLSVW